MTTTPAATGVIPSAPAIETDALVVGAGPVGLFQVFELGLLELHAEVVDALPHIGGQCAELYPGKPIYDIPGLPVVSGADLVSRLQQQAAPFKPGLHLDQLVSDLARRDDGRFDVATSRGTRFIARCVFIAAGAGAFLPKALKLDGVERFIGRQVHHRLPDPATLAGQQVLVLGDDDGALQAANQLAEGGRCASVTLLHRRDSFRASADTLARHHALRADGRLRFVAGQPVALCTADGDAQRLTGLDVIDSDGATHPLVADTVLPLLGLSPRLGPIADWGLAMERRQLTVTTDTFETAEPGIHAVGDINTYPGKRKLLLCGFHEATLAAFGAAARLAGGKPPLLQYTTTSPRLHALLGVDGADR
jgi:thioredoxin reductase (NADPH)